MADEREPARSPADAEAEAEASMSGAPEDRANAVGRKAQANHDREDLEDDDSLTEAEAIDASEDEDEEPIDADDVDGDADEGEDDEPSIAAPPEGRRRWSVGPLLLAAGAGIWGFVALMRCAGPPEAPPLTVDQDEDPEPAIVRPPDESPEPTSTDREPTRPSEPEAGDEPIEPPAPVEGADPHPPPAPWAKDLELPTKVPYTIVRGGSLENVANLFKIYHHEIQALNPGIALDKELAPGTTIVLHEREPDAVSESVGTPSAGSLEGAVPMVPGRGRRVMAIGWKRWGTAHTIALLDRVLDQWAERGPEVQPVLVGNISAPKGGRLEPHSTHQSGRDVDLGYLQKMRPGEEHNWREMNEVNLDAAETWALIKLLVQTGQVEVIYIDRSIQKLLYDHAVSSGVLPKRVLSQWLEYPAPTGSGSPLIRHVAGHTDHMHVRFECPKGQSRCRS